MKKTKRNTFLAVCLSLALTACANPFYATNEFDARIIEAEEESYQASIEAVNAPKPILEIKGEFMHTCTEKEKVEGECSFTVFDTKIKQIAPERKENAIVSTIREVKEGVLGLAPMARDVLVVKEVGNMMEAAVKHAGGNTTNTDSGNTFSEANQTAGADIVTGSKDASVVTTSTATESIGGDKAGGDINNSQQNQNNPITEDNSINDSNNPSDSSDNSNNSVTNTTQEEVVDDNNGN